MKEEIAKTFVALLALAVTASDFNEIAKRNKEEADKGVCHSHDFIDANEVMAEAFDVCNQPFDLNNQLDVTLWSGAWDEAKEIIQMIGESAPVVKNERLINALKAFETAYNELNGAWEDFADLPASINDLYPFRKSFDEYNIPIHEWVKKSTKDLSK